MRDSSLNDREEPINESAIEDKIKSKLEKQYQETLDTLEKQAKEAIAIRDEKIGQMRTEKKGASSDVQQKTREVALIKEKHEVLVKQYAELNDMSKKGE